MTKRLKMKRRRKRKRRKKSWMMRKTMRK